MKTISLVVAVTSLFTFLVHVALFFSGLGSNVEKSMQTLVEQLALILWYGSISLFFFTLYRRQK